MKSATERRLFPPTQSEKLLVRRKDFNMRFIKITASQLLFLGIFLLPGPVSAEDDPAAIDDDPMYEQVQRYANVTHSMASCEAHPPVGEFNPLLEWAWTSSNALSNSLNVMMTPAVIDMNADNIPDIVFGSTSSTGGGYMETDVLRAVSGDSEGHIERMVDPAGNEIVYNDNAVGNPIETIDPAGNSTHQSYDEHGRLISSEDANCNLTIHMPDNADPLAQVNDTYDLSSRNTTLERFSFENGVANVTSRSYLKELFKLHMGSLAKKSDSEAEECFVNMASEGIFGDVARKKRPVLAGWRTLFLTE